MTTLTSTRIKIIAALLIASIVAGALAIYVFSLEDHIINNDLYQFYNVTAHGNEWTSGYWHARDQFIGPIAAVILLAVSAILILLFARNKNASVTVFGLVIPFATVCLSLFSILNFDVSILQIVYVTLPSKPYYLRLDGASAFKWILPFQAYSTLLHVLFGILFAAAITIPFLSYYRAKEISTAEKPGFYRVREKITKNQILKLLSFALATAGGAAITGSLFTISQITKDSSKTEVAQITGTAQIPALLGLGLVFWSVLFIYIRPEEYVKKTLLSAIAYPEMTTMNHIINELDFKGNPLYLPPKYFSNPKVQKAFIPAKNQTAVPTPLQIKTQEANMFITVPSGIIVTPPGSEMTSLFEKKLGKKLDEENLRDLQRILPKIMTEDLAIAQGFEMQIETDKIQVKIENSVFSKPIQQKEHQDYPFASPLGSAIAFALAKSTGHPIRIENEQTSADGKYFTVQYRIVDEEENTTR